MKISILPHSFTVCKLNSLADIPLDSPFFFFARTDGELSLVCPTEDVPARTEAREDGWRAFRVEGPLDFSLVGILAQISAVLAEKGIALFAVSTYDTDTVLVRSGDLDAAVRALREAGWQT